MVKGYQKYLQSVQKEAIAHRKKLEREFRDSHRGWTDEQLLNYLANICRRMGRNPKEHEVTGSTYLKERLRRPWKEIVRLARQMPGAGPELAAAPPEKEEPVLTETPQSSDDTLRRIAQDRAFAEAHSGDTDEELLAYLRQRAEELGHAPTKAEVVGAAYIKERFVYWNIALTLAGLPMPAGTRPPKEQDIIDYRTGRLRERAEAKRRKQENCEGRALRSCGKPHS